MAETLKISVNRVCYPPETTENATWFILDTSEGTCKGTMGWRPKPRERLALKGRYKVYQGKREFAFESAALDIPTDSRGMLHYVCELAVGVGAALEEQIWELKGENWSAIDEGELPRFKGRVFASFMEAVERAETDREKGGAISELLRAGCSMNLAALAYEKWGASTLGVVASDPYRLAELPNYGFKDVDEKVRQHYGIGDDDPRRIRAAVVYVLRQMTDSGSTLVGIDALRLACLERLGGYDELIKAAISEMFEDGTLRGFAKQRTVALARDYRNEEIIWEFVRGLDEVAVAAGAVAESESNEDKEWFE